MQEDDDYTIEELEEIGELLGWKDVEEVLDEIPKLLQDGELALDKEEILDHILYESPYVTGDDAEKIADAIVKIYNETNEDDDLPQNIIIKKTYTFQDYNQWDTELFEAGLDFKDHFGIYPHILISNPYTMRRIDMVSNFGKKKENIRKGDEMEEIPESGEYAQLSEFVCDFFRVIFALDSEMEDDQFTLVFDSDPDWGGEPYEDEEEHEMKQAA